MLNIQTETTEQTLLHEFERTVCKCYERLIIAESDNCTVMGTEQYIEVFHYHFDEAVHAYNNYMSYLEYGRVITELTAAERTELEDYMEDGWWDGITADGFTGEIMEILSERNYVVFCSASMNFSPEKPERINIANSPLQEVW